MIGRKNCHVRDPRTSSFGTYEATVDGTRRRVVGPVRAFPSGLPYYVSSEGGQTEWVPAVAVSRMTPVDGGESDLRELARARAIA